MAQVEYTKEINCPIEKVYEVSQDYSVRYEWDPFPENIEMLNGATDVAKGVQVNVVAKSGLKMIVEFVQVSPPKVAAIKMVKGPFILKSFAGSWIFKELRNGNTKATFKYSIQAKSWVLPKVSNRLLCWYFGRKVKDRLDGLAMYCKQLN